MASYLVAADGAALVVVAGAATFYVGGAGADAVLGMLGLGAGATAAAQWGRERRSTIITPEPSIDAVLAAFKDLGDLDKLAVASQRGFVTVRFGFVVSLFFLYGSTTEKRLAFTDVVRHYYGLFGHAVTHYQKILAARLTPIRTERTGIVIVVVPILPQLAQTLAASPVGKLTYLATVKRRPFVRGHSATGSKRPAALQGSQVLPTGYERRGPASRRGRRD